MFKIMSSFSDEIVFVEVFDDISTCPKATRTELCLNVTAHLVNISRASCDAEIGVFLSTEFVNWQPYHWDAFYEFYRNTTDQK